jgi:hypothetical protein
VPDKRAVLAGCHRVLRAGGRLAFTDWIAGSRLADGERRRLDEWMAARTLQTLDGYRRLLGGAGFVAVEAHDVSDEWRPVLRARHRTFRELRAETEPRLGRTRWDEYDQLFAFFVELVERGKVGGGRFTATR